MSVKPELKRDDLIYPDLSYKVVGCAFDVHNSLGSGHHEKYYQRALAEAFKEKGLKVIEQVFCPIIFNEKVVAKNFFDFLLDDKLIVEIKKGDNFSKRHIDQVLEYLKTSKIKLAILVNFGSTEVKVKRIVNFD
ncbi:GxxExxY protein [Patescibacteria group bacterium]|nr:GxxExxY protein [Patescibacteria group bacterium]